METPNLKTIVENENLYGNEIKTGINQISNDILQLLETAFAFTTLITQYHNQENGRQDPFFAQLTDYLTDALYDIQRRVRGNDEEV